jgi:hypothetical protein
MTWKNPSEQQLQDLISIDHAFLGGHESGGEKFRAVGN